MGVRRFYKLEEAVELLTNMSDCEESTSESKNEGDSSDSSEVAPEQHQVRTDSNILMPKETKVSKAREIPKNGQKAAPKPVDNQSATKHALLADQTATTSGEEHVASPPKVPKNGQKAAPKPVDNQSATKAMASDSSDMDVEDYYVIEDANESASSKYVPWVNYANGKVYPEDVWHIGKFRFSGELVSFKKLGQLDLISPALSFLVLPAGTICPIEPTGVGFMSGLPKNRMPP